MEFITGKHIQRRTFLKGMGATVALPFLDAMVPAGRKWSRIAGDIETNRLVCIEMVHGAAGCSDVGAELNMWAPAGVGRDFDLRGTSLEPLESFREYLTIISHTDVRMAEAYQPAEIGGDHFRSSAVFLTQSHPRQTESSDIFVGKSLDQVFADRHGQTTPLPSMQLCIENVDRAGGCAYGYSCVYTDSISWASPTEPLPMIRDPRVAFNQLFGAGGSPEERAFRRQTQGSILDWINQSVSDLMRELRAQDRHRVEQYLENIREVERRIQNIEERNASGEMREIPEAPVGVPDSFSEHVRLMFDLQALALESDMTRVFSFKMGRDASARVYPESGTERPFHPASHHGNQLDHLRDFATINRYHVSMLPYFLERLKNTEETDGTLLDKTVIIYGSPMADGNLHSHRRCPLVLLGGGGGLPRGGVHFKAPDGTPMANVFVGLMGNLGFEDMNAFGDSTGRFSFNNIPASAVVDDA